MTCSEQWSLFSSSFAHDCMRFFHLPSSSLVFISPGNDQIFLVYHRADEEYLYVEGLGIRTGDCFQFYAPNDSLALSTCNKVSVSLERLNLGIPADSCHRTVPTSGNSSVKKEEVFGGFIFSCCGRGEYFLGPLKADTSPFTKNFPGVPVAGVFCGGEIGRCSRSLSEQNPEGARPVSLCSHVFSSVYLVMTYTPPPPY